VAYPDRYGVWNGILEASLRELGLWSDQSVRGLSYGIKKELRGTVKTVFLNRKITSLS